MSKVGICDMALYVPKLYLNIEKLAIERDLEYGKLNKGLGLQQMRIPDLHEDAATMAANAIYELMERNQLKPQEIGRIYLGTESALDGAKPTATYVLEMLRRKYKQKHGVHCLRNCDVVDLTFACIGAVDALHNTLDWVRGGKNRKAIVVASDFAKYELNSGGEYTQGAGAIAMLVKQNPRLIAIDDVVGVATQGVHDFFKPRRVYSKKEILREVLDLMENSSESAEDVLKKLPESLQVDGFLDANEDTIQVFKETPVFDGQYSNWTYQNRIREAYEHFCEQQLEENQSEANFFGDWDRLIFHLPYAFHAKRIASELFMHARKKQNTWDDAELKAPQRSDFQDEKTYEKARGQFLRAITKTEAYRNFATQKLEKAERASSLMGNIYASSIFLALMSSFEADLEEGSDLTDHTFGFFGYGSGSKSKVFQGKVQESWKSVVADFKVFQKLSEGVEIDYPSYEKIHRDQLSESIRIPTQEFSLDRVSEAENKAGARYYKWVE
ncbi:MAG: hydroxymethylglutaryl-CoA synthase family protein [Salibacteraceae bacterium]